MSKHVRTTIRYDGPDLADHEMDVNELAPALLALADMIQLTNRKFNGDTATVRVLVRADVEQRCFQLDIHIVQSILESARHLFSTQDYKTAKEIAEILGILGTAGLAGARGVFWLWKQLFGKEKAKPLTSYEITQSGGTTIINNFYGDGSHLEAPTTVFEAATDPEIADKGARVLQPLERDGYDKVGFYEDDKAVVEVSDEEAVNIIPQLPSPSAPTEEHWGPQHIDGQVKIKSAVYDGDAQWDLWWAGRTRKMKIEHRDWVEAFQRREVEAPPGSWLDVHMVMQPAKEPNGQPTFVVTEVKAVISPPNQDGLFDQAE